MSASADHAADVQTATSDTGHIQPDLAGSHVATPPVEATWPHAGTSDRSHPLSNTDGGRVSSPEDDVGDPQPATRDANILTSLRIIQQEFWTLSSREKCPQHDLTPKLTSLRERLKVLTGFQTSENGWLAVTTGKSDAIFDGQPEIAIEFALFLYDQVSSLLYDPSDPLRVCQEHTSSIWSSLRALEREFLDISSRACSDESPDWAQLHKNRVEISNVRIKLQQLTGLETGKKEWITEPTRKTREVFEHEPRDAFHLANRLYTHLSFFISSYISETMMSSE